MTPRRLDFTTTRRRSRTAAAGRRGRNRSPRPAPAHARVARHDVVAAWLMTRGLWAVLAASAGLATVARLAILGEGDVLLDD